ncbi:MAG: hypothetical protein LBG06_05530, partial [Deltaproteobacteria bacterium]|nr:hypothetical protein [Deltaproteobacteria bacterium]
MHSQGMDIMALGLSGEELLARLFDDFFYGVTIVNASSEIVYYNETQGLIDGIDPADALGRNLNEIHRPDGPAPPTVAAGLSRTPALNRPCLYRTPSGRLVNSVQNAFPIAKDGVLLGCVTFIGEYGRIMDAYAEAAGARFLSARDSAECGCACDRAGAGGGAAADASPEGPSAACGCPAPGPPVRPSSGVTHPPPPAPPPGPQPSPDTGVP